MNQLFKKEIHYRHGVFVNPTYVRQLKFVLYYIFFTLVYILHFRTNLSPAPNAHFRIVNPSWF